MGKIPERLRLWWDKNKKRLNTIPPIGKDEIDYADENCIECTVLPNTEKIAEGKVEVGLEDGLKCYVGEYDILDLIPLYDGKEIEIYIREKDGSDD